VKKKLLNLEKFWKEKHKALIVLTIEELKYKFTMTIGFSVLCITQYILLVEEILDHQAKWNRSA
jgi:hypothetical protein